MGVERRPWSSAGQQLGCSECDDEVKMVGESELCVKVRFSAEAGGLFRKVSYGTVAHAVGTGAVPIESAETRSVK